MLRKPSLSLKKIVKPKRLMKAIKGHQRPQIKKVKKSHFIKSPKAKKGLQRPKIEECLILSIIMEKFGLSVSRHHTKQRWGLQLNESSKTPMK